MNNFRVAVFQGVRDTDDSLAVHILPRVKVIGQVMLAVMQYQMYIFRSEVCFFFLKIKLQKYTSTLNWRNSENLKIQVLKKNPIYQH